MSLHKTLKRHDILAVHPRSFKPLLVLCFTSCCIPLYPPTMPIGILAILQSPVQVETCTHEAYPSHSCQKRWGSSSPSANTLWDLFRPKPLCRQVMASGKWEHLSKRLIIYKHLNYFKQSNVYW